jgi:hypothetical protein
MQNGIDEKERFEFLREIAEHNAMFWNPEGVNEVRSARENTFKTTEEDFDSSLKELFGRELPNREENPQNVSAEDVIQASGKNPYLDMDLDEINFVPTRGD